MSKVPRISVLTPTYNRADTLPRLFKSLMAQTFRDFEWIVVDDGSEDKTEEIVEEFKVTADFPITFIKKKNGGKHTALNVGVPLLKGEFVFQIDSDDELTPNAMKIGLEIWESLQKPEEYWAVCGRCIYPDTGKMVGDPVPENINALSKSEQKKINNICNLRDGGERFSLIRTEVLKKYPFPEPKECKFIPEDYVWKTIDCDYKQWYVNDVFRLYYQDQTNQLTRQGATYSTLYPAYIFYLQFINYIYRKDGTYSYKMLLDKIIRMCYSAVRCDIRFSETYEKIKHQSDRFWLLLFFPCMYFAVVIKGTIRTCKMK